MKLDSGKGCTQSDIAGNPTFSPPVNVMEEALAPKIDILESSADNLDSTEKWHEVKRKHSSPADSKSISNPPAVPPNQLKDGPSIAAGSLPLYSALSRTLSKSQRKKARQSGGKNPPSKH
ncbi:hypothetical protein ACET3Z_004990 [Daucus carota]